MQGRRSFPVVVVCLFKRERMCCRWFATVTMLALKACALELARYLRVASIQLSRGSVNVKAISRQFLEIAH